ncbi:TIGR03557 family F420-dependent LLM class oxidoreductase [Halorubrum sp. CBA1125]|uniref:TIGR03557 family F420-dependent LLM class oxidoreductase n=1 Tax=Halorubrum sp. CBA1125 TaxID=2668072 RepID=UPI0012E87667|nr:TIGR03557 family F420-dependent LLM class oxidoreductase [Halorubrum sp. CBA1125]MUW13365.1 TIGR03557 family F420-dependent LLM class oxidoreductase [Halorubrum sp. CBA1125]
MDIGLFTAHEEYDPSTLLEHVSLAEGAGFDTVWTSDHIHPWWHTDAHCGAAWPWLGAALERSDSVRIGTGVTPPIGRYHPGMIAQAFATLGAMYPGRVHLALSTGEAMNEVPLGYEWPAYPERRRRLVDACEIITRLWDGEVVDYEGHYWETNSLNLYTRPDERVPLYVAGNGPKTTRVAGEYADGFLTLVDNARYRESLVPALEAGAEAAGRDPDDIRRIKQLLVSYDEDYENALESVGFWRGPQAVGFDQSIADPREIEEAGRKLSLEEMTDSWIIADDPDDLRTALDDARNAGFDEVEIHSASPDQHAFVELMADEILPRY